MSKCISCKTNPAKWQEETNRNKVYCSKTCQKKLYSLVGLKDPNADPPIDDNDKIGLVSSDGAITIVINRSEAEEMKTIIDLEQDVGSDEYIPLLSVNGFALNQIEYFLKNGTIKSNLTNKEFITLLQAANYLDFQRLILYMMPEWVNKRPFPVKELPIELARQAIYFYIGTDLERFSKSLGEEFIRPFINFLDYSFHVPKPRKVFIWQIHMAVTNGQANILELLLKDKRFGYLSNGYIIMQIAVNGGYTKIMELLLQDGRFDPALAENGILNLAAAEGKVEIVELLLKDERVVDESVAYTLGKRILQTAAEWGEVEVVKLLLKDKHVYITNDNNVIYLAALHGEYDVVEILLKDGRANPVGSDNGAIQVAARNMYNDVVELLLKDGRADGTFLQYSKDMQLQELYRRYVLKEGETDAKKLRLQNKIV